MKVTINIPRKVVYFAGGAHDLSRTGVNRLYAWLQDNGRLLWGWVEHGEYVFQVEV